jgi:hypothetical protein
MKTVQRTANYPADEACKMMTVDRMHAWRIISIQTYTKQNGEPRVIVLMEREEHE